MKSLRFSVTILAGARLGCGEQRAGGGERARAATACSRRRVEREEVAQYLPPSPAR